jgi:hypothetical protein
MKRLLCLAALSLAIGCNPPRLDLDDTFDVDGGSAQRILPPVRQAQKVKIDVKASTPVDVFVYLEKNKDAAQKEIFNPKGGANLLADKRKIDAVQFEVSIPPAESTVIDIMPGLKKAKVTLKATN